MRFKNYIITLLFLLFTHLIVAQIVTEPTRTTPVYRDYISDEDGNRLQGIKVQVFGGDSDITDYRGNFKVHANIGDQIILYKGGERINSYVYDGGSHYEVQDYSAYKEESKVSKRTTSLSNNSYKIALDSAAYFVKKNPTKSFIFIEKALHATSNKKQQAKAYEILADSFIALKQYDLALSNYNTAYSVLKKSISLQLKLANALYKNKQISKSKIIYIKVLGTKKATTYQRIIANEGLADIYKNTKEYTLSIKHLKTGLLLAEQHVVTPKITILNTKLAEVLSLQGNRKKSQVYINNAIKSATKESKNKAIAQRNTTANYYRENDLVDEEIKLRKETLKDLEAVVNHKIETPEAHVSRQKVKYDLGNALEKQQNYNEAIQFYKESAADAIIDDDIETQKNAIQGLSEVYAKIGDDNNALINYKKYTKLVDVLYQQKEQEIEKAISLGKDLATKQNRILSLEKDKELNESKLNLVKTEQNLIKENNKRQQLIIYSLIGGLLLLLLSLFYMFRANKQRKLSNNLLALKSLRSQMNPHFIFNALNAVNSFIASNDERTANRYLTDFSMLMRSVLDNSEQDFIPLTKEVELLDLYLKLEHTRFKDKFDYQLNIAKNVVIEDFQIPPMLLQPYVENAVWHGLRYKKEKGLLQINLEQTDRETLQITISDNGIGRKKSKALKSKNQLQHKSKGMQNIKQRIAILNKMYHDKVDVFISDLSENETGTKVVLVLKKD